METADQSLATAYAEVNAEISRSDSKASALLAALGLPMAVLVAAIPGSDLSTAGTILAGVAVAGFVAAILTTLYVLHPHFGSETRGSFLRWAECTPDELLAELATETRLAQLVTRSKIARRKFAAVRVATRLTAASIVALALTLLVVLADK